MYICQFPASIKNEMRKDLTAYFEAFWTDDFKDDLIQTKEEAIEYAMNEKLLNILDTSEKAIEYGLTWEKYGRLLREWGITL